MNNECGRLTLVGTPIGNLSDFSPRAIEALQACDFIAAEDTRVTLKLLNHFGIQKPLVSYHDHNRRERGEQLCARLLAGEQGVLVSDAERREQCPFRYREPCYPAYGGHCVFPNMIFSQMMAYLWEDGGLYMATHDEKRGVKSFNFHSTEKGLTPEMPVSWRGKWTHWVGRSMPIPQKK